MRHLSPALIPVTASLLLMAGCSPEIYTNIQKRLPARIEGSPVLVYDLTDTLPDSFEVLGSVGVNDTGFSTGCHYEGVIEMAKTETNKVGGNGLHLVWHKEPGALGKSCHQISADILSLSDSVFAASYAWNLEAQKARASLYASPSRKAYDKDVKNGKKVSPRYNILHISAGYGLMTSEFNLPRNCDGDPKQGFAINAGYQWVSRLGIGIGLRYSGYFTSGKQRYVSMETDYEKLNISTHYIAPEFVFYQNASRRWTFHEVVGIGYARYFEGMMHNTESVGGFGIHAAAGFSYRIKPWLGIGANFLVQHSRFDSESRTLRQRISKDNTSITHMSINGGLSFYFF